MVAGKSICIKILGLQPGKVADRWAYLSEICAVLGSTGTDRGLYYTAGFESAPAHYRQIFAMERAVSRIFC